MAQYFLEIVESASREQSLCFNKACRVSIKHGSGTSGISAQLLLTSLDFTKKVYEPCHIKASINITVDGGGLPNLADVKGYFAGDTKYSLFVGDAGSAGGCLIKNCFAYRVAPVYPRSDDRTSLTVNLDIYSCDFLLTLRKYSASYVAKKFAGEVIPAGIKKFDNLYDENKYNMSLKVASMQFLHYLGGKDKTETRELIQPYLVQYNESFYDFIARTARRCGEFLYFEDGNLKIGLDDITKVSKIENYESLSYEYLYDNTGSDLESGIYNNCLDSGRGAQCKQKFPYNSEIAADENLFSFRKGEYETFWNALWMWDTGEGIAYALPTSGSSEETVISILVTMGLGALFAGLDNKAENNKFDNKFFRDYNPSNLAEHLDNEEDSGKASKITPFSTQNPGSWNIVLSLYDKVRGAQKEVKEGMATIRLGRDLRKTSVGEMIEVDGAKYVVVEVGATGCNPKNPAAMNILAAPLASILIDGSSKFIPVPPVLDDKPSFRSAGPQTAFVADNDDPLRMGRVRIKYPWQSKEDAASPYIRIATPLATKDGGAYFRPMIGDEVLVDYDNGNVERPYVTGSLFSKDVNVPYGGRRSIDAAMIAGNGMGMYVHNNRDAGPAWISSLGGLGLAMSFIPFFQELGDTEFLKKVMGGLEIRDRYGITAINLNTQSRSVQIKSPLGDVSINAFTGITIDAPNGDVNIRGKNVRIEAMNNMTIVSGTTQEPDVCNKDLYSSWTGLGDLVPHVLMDVVVPSVPKIIKKSGLIDMSFLRNLWEVFVKPVEGTMQIKSWKFLLMSAGEGQAEISPDNFNDKKFLDLENSPQRKLYKTIKLIDMYLDTCIDSYVHYYNLFAHQLTEYNTKLRPRTKVTFDDLLADDFAARVENLFDDGNPDHSKPKKDGGLEDDGDAIAKLISWADQIHTALMCLKEWQRPAFVAAAKHYFFTEASAIVKAYFDDDDNVKNLYKNLQNAADVADPVMSVRNNLRDKKIGIRRAMYCDLIQKLKSARLSSDEIAFKYPAVHIKPNIVDNLNPLEDNDAIAGEDVSKEAFIQCGKVPEHAKLDDDYEWGRFVDSIDFSEEYLRKHKWRDYTHGFFIKMAELNGMADDGKMGWRMDSKQVWSASSNGKLLISDTKGKTTSIEGEKLTTTTNYSMARIRELLKSK